MSIEQLRSDMKESATALSVLASNPLTTTSDVVAFLRDTLWPTIVAAVDEMEEIDGCVADILNKEEDILQPETAALFGAILVSGRALATELEKRTRPDESDVRKAIAGFREMATAAEAAIEEITIADGEDPPDDGEYPDGDGEDE